MKKLLFALLIFPLFALGQTQIKFPQINPNLPANYKIANSGFSFGADSIYLGTIGIHSTPSGNIIFFGTSITVGVGVTTGGTRYSTLVANAMGLTENNVGISGAHIQQTGDGFGFQDHMSSVPSYSSSNKMLVVECGPNDLNNYTGVGGTFQPTQYQTDFTTEINYFLTTKGYPASQILILQNSYYNNYNTNRTTTVETLYKAATLAVATAKGTLFCDVNTFFATHGGLFLMYDGLHPNNQGYFAEANAILGVLNPSTVYRNAQNIAANGLVEFANLKINNTNILPDAASNILGVDGLGNAGLITALPNNTRTAGNLFLGGKLISSSAYTSYLNGGITSLPTLGSQDWVLAPNIIYGLNSTNLTDWVSLQLDNFLSGLTINKQGAYGNILTLQGGEAYFDYLGNLAVPSINLNTGVGGTGTYGYGITFNAGGGQGALIPFDTDFGASIENTYINGQGISFITAPVTNGSGVKIARFSEVGSLIIGSSIIANESGFQIEVGNDTRVDGTTNFGAISNVFLTSNPTTSTTGGTLPALTKYYYQVFALDYFGNTTGQPIGTSEGSVTTGAGSTNSNTVTWTGVTGNYGYRIYQGTAANSEGKYFTVAQGATSAVDIGTGYTTAAMPKVNKTAWGQVNSTGLGSFTGLKLPSIISKPLYTDASGNITETAPSGVIAILASSQTTLVAGTKAISTPGVTTVSHAFVTCVSQGGTVTTTAQYIAVCTSGTVTISAVTNSGSNTVNSADTSTINYFVTN